jgi:hypothetical protein
LKEYARRGAETRIAELQQELKAIFRAFPDLAKGQSRGTRGGSKLIKVEETFGAPVRRRRRKMTAAQRKAVGERMRAYWAARKAGAKKR